MRRRRNPFPGSAGEGGPKGRTGCGPLLPPLIACLEDSPNFPRERLAFRTPSVAFGDTFPGEAGEGGVE